jgi:thiamine-phosphate pyrophosphorylase
VDGRPSFALPRLYAILDVDLAAAAGRAPTDLLAAWLDAGVRLIQLRAKQLASGALLDLAAAATASAHAAGARLIVNDRADIARLVGADGVHLGQDDLRPADVRHLLEPRLAIGLSTHNAGQIAAALAEPIDYLAIGPIFGTQSKARPDPMVGLEAIRLARSLAGTGGVPIVAIGGITLGHAPAALDAGADAVAVIGDLLRGDPAARVRAFLEVLG